MSRWDSWGNRPLVMFWVSSMTAEAEKWLASIENDCKGQVMNVLTSWRKMVSRLILQGRFLSSRCILGHSSSRIPLKVKELMLQDPERSVSETPLARVSASLLVKPIFYRAKTRCTKKLNASSFIQFRTIDRNELINRSFPQIPCTFNPAGYAYTLYDHDLSPFHLLPPD